MEERVGVRGPRKTRGRRERRTRWADGQLRTADGCVSNRPDESGRVTGLFSREGCRVAVKGCEEVVVAVVDGPLILLRLGWWPVACLSRKWPFSPSFARWAGEERLRGGCSARSVERWASPAPAKVRRSRRAEPRMVAAEESRGSSGRPGGAGKSRSGSWSEGRRGWCKREAKFFLRPGAASGLLGPAEDKGGADETPSLAAGPGRPGGGALMRDARVDRAVGGDRGRRCERCSQRGGSGFRAWHRRGRWRGNAVGADEGGPQGSLRFILVSMMTGNSLPLRMFQGGMARTLGVQRVRRGSVRVSRMSRWEVSAPRRRPLPKLQMRTKPRLGVCGCFWRLRARRLGRWRRRGGGRHRWLPRDTRASRTATARPILLAEEFDCVFCERRRAAGLACEVCERAAGSGRGEGDVLAEDLGPRGGGGTEDGGVKEQGEGSTEGAGRGREVKRRREGGASLACHGREAPDRAQQPVGRGSQRRPPMRCSRNFLKKKTEDWAANASDGRTGKFHEHDSRSFTLPQILFRGILNLREDPGWAARTSWGPPPRVKYPG